VASAAALFPVTTVRYMKLWTGYYCRWKPIKKLSTYIIYKVC
jgi:hypothetical protein